MVQMHTFEIKNCDMSTLGHFGEWQSVSLIQGVYLKRFSQSMFCYVSKSILTLLNIIHFIDYSWNFLYIDVSVSIWLK